MSISPIAAAGMREHLRALERAASNVASPARSFESDVEAASAPSTESRLPEARPTIPAVRAHDPLPLSLIHI